MMKRSLSSQLTVVFKFFPALWIPFFGLGVLGTFLGAFQGKNGVPPSLSFNLLFLSLWIVGSIFGYVICAALKEISIDERCLYVSNYLREISIPLTEIHDVTENTWINLHPVTVHLRRTSVFGDRITFMPKFDISSIGGSHSVVAELKTLALLAKA
jgi:hypothetical protein